MEKDDEELLGVGVVGVLTHLRSVFDLSEKVSSIITKYWLSLDHTLLLQVKNNFALMIQEINSANEELEKIIRITRGEI